MSSNQTLFPAKALPRYRVSMIKHPIMKTTLKNLAEACGVDISTVSRGLRDDPRVKEETREKIKVLAIRMGYSPNLAARTLVAGKSGTIWFMLPSLRHSLEQLPAQNAAIYLNQKYNYDMLAALHHNDYETYIRWINRLNQGVADGVIIIPGPTKSGGGLVKSLLNQNYPMVFIDRHPANIKAARVVTDNCRATSMMMENSYQDGCEAVINITANYADNAAIDRGKGIRDVCKKYKMKLVLGSEESIITEKLPQNIVVYGSSQKLLCYFMRNNSVLSQKHNIYICCFDQWYGEPYPAKKVTVAIQDFNKMSEIACDMLMKMIKGKKIITDKVKVPIQELQTIIPAG